MAQHGDAHTRNTLPNTTTQTVQEGTRSTPATSAPVTISVVLRPRKKVSWNEDTVDNEHLQKKSSKICCIYHKKETLEDSSDDEDDCGSAGKGKRPCPHRGSDFAESSEKRNE